MKTLLNKLGYVSRPVVIGAALGVATVAVGVGVVSQFAGGKGESVSTAALGQYAAPQSPAKQTFTKEELEARMQAAQAQRAQAGGLNTLQGAADANGGFSLGRGSNAPGAAAQQADGGPGSVASMGGNASLGALGAMGTGDGLSAVQQGFIPGGEGMEAAAAAALARQQAGAQGVAGLDASAQQQAAAQLRAGKAVGGFGGGSISGSGGGASSGVSASLQGYGAAAGDGGQAIPSGAAAGLPAAGSGMAAFQGGRAGAMGGSNMAGGRGGGPSGSGQQAFSSLGDLATATRYSQMGANTVYGDATKGAALAAEAFDGGVPTEGITMNPGEGVTQQANQAMERMANTLNTRPQYGTNIPDQVTNDHEKAQDLRKKITGKILAMVGIAVAGAYPIQALMNGGVVAKILGIVGGLGALASIYALMFGFGSNGNSIQDMIKELAGLKYGGGAGGRMNVATTLFAISAAIIGVSMIPGSFAAIGKAIAKAAKAVAKAVSKAAKAVGEKATGLWKGLTGGPKPPAPPPPPTYTA